MLDTRTTAAFDIAALAITGTESFCTMSAKTMASVCIIVYNLVPPETLRAEPMGSLDVFAKIAFPVDGGIP